MLSSFQDTQTWWSWTFSKLVYLIQHVWFHINITIIMIHISTTITATIISVDCKINEHRNDYNNQPSVYLPSHHSNIRVFPCSSSLHCWITFIAIITVTVPSPSLKQGIRSTLSCSRQWWAQSLKKKENDWTSFVSCIPRVWILVKSLFQKIICNHFHHYLETGDGSTLKGLISCQREEKVTWETGRARRIKHGRWAKRCDR